MRLIKIFEKSSPHAGLSYIWPAVRAVAINPGRRGNHSLAGSNSCAVRSLCGAATFEQNVSVVTPEPRSSDEMGTERVCVGAFVGVCIHGTHLPAVESVSLAPTGT